MRWRAVGHLHGGAGHQPHASQPHGGPRLTKLPTVARAAASCEASWLTGEGVVKWLTDAPVRGCAEHARRPHLELSRPVVFPAVRHGGGRLTPARRPPARDTLGVRARAQTRPRCNDAAKQRTRTCLQSTCVGQRKPISRLLGRRVGQRCSRHHARRAIPPAERRGARLSAAQTRLLGAGAEGRARRLRRAKRALDDQLACGRPHSL